MKPSDEIPIRLVSISEKAWLSLHGTILTYRCKSGGAEQVVDIPLELVSISGRKKFMGSRFIYSLIGLMVGPAAGGLATGVYYIFSKSLPDPVLNACLGIGFMLGAIVSLVLFIWFLRREETAILELGEDGGSIEFWLTGRERHTLEGLLGHVEKRTAMVEEEIPYPLNYGTSDYLYNPWRRALGITFLFALPGIMTEFPPLLLLAVLPPVWFTCKALMSLKQPRSFRRAGQYCCRGRWEEAMELVEESVKRGTDHIPTHLMYAELLCRLGRFDEASGALTDVQEALDIEYLQAFQEDMILRQRIWDRKQEAVA